MSTIQPVKFGTIGKVIAERPSAEQPRTFDLKTSTFLMSLTIFTLIILTIIIAPPKWDEHSGLAATIDKHNRLESCKSPKVVFIGGSNVYLSLDSGAVQKALHRDVVNMGLGISLGLRYQLEEVRDQIRPGDLLVVMPEYCNFYDLSKEITNAHFNGSSDLIHVVQVNPRAWRWLWAVYSSSPKAFIGGIDDFRRFICFKTKFYQKLLGEIAHSPRKLLSKDLLRPTQNLFTHRENANSFGDFIGHINLPSPPLPTGEPISFDDYKKFNYEATDFLDRFAADAEARGARLVILPPVFPGHLKCDLIANDIYLHWKRLKHARVLASPDRYAFERSELFDSEYHTNAIGRQRRTSMVIEDLSKYLEIPSKGQI